MNDQLTLFNLNSFESVRPHDPYSKVESISGNPVHDPYWDELEKDKRAKLTAGLSQSHFSLETESVVDLSAPPDCRVGEQIFCPGAAEDCSVGEQISCPGAAEDCRVGEQISCPGAADTQYSSVGEQVAFDTKKTAPQHETQTTHWVEKYWVERGNNKYWYYRYMWMEGRKMRRLYIGSVNSGGARNKVDLIENAITSGQSPFEIKQLVANSNLKDNHHRLHSG